MIAADLRILWSSPFFSFKSADPQFSLFHVFLERRNLFTRVTLAVAAIDCTAQYSDFAVHGNKTWSAKLGNLLVHSQVTSFVHYQEMHFCAQGCAPLGHFKSLDTWVHKRCTSLVIIHLRRTNFCTSCAHKCRRTWSVQVVHNLVHKGAFPGSAQGLLPLSAQASFQVAHSSSYCCGIKWPTVHVLSEIFSACSALHAFGLLRLA